MNEGWYNNEYLAIFSQAESSIAAEKYKLDLYLPGYTLIGLRDWDDFIVVSPAGVMCSLPTVPTDVARAESFTLSASVALEPDARFTGKIEWYVKPLIFGGEPNDKEKCLVGDS
nr:putative integron gene cassette protein [uncultured bacterium]